MGISLAVGITWPLKMEAAIDCFTSHVGEHGTLCGPWKQAGNSLLFQNTIKKIMQQSLEKEMPLVYITLATHVTLVIARHSLCLFEYSTIWLTHHNQTHVSQSECLLVKPQRTCANLCTEPVGMSNKPKQPYGSIEDGGAHQDELKMVVPIWMKSRRRSSIWASNRHARYLRRHRAHCDGTVMSLTKETDHGAYTSFTPAIPLIRVFNWFLGSGLPRSRRGRYSYHSYSVGVGFRGSPAWWDAKIFRCENGGPTLAT